jgi:hypothetical protein
VRTLSLETRKNGYARQDESCLQADCRANMKISYDNLHQYFANLKNNIQWLCITFGRATATKCLVLFYQLTKHHC